METKWIEFESSDYLKAVALRSKILREPLGLKFDPADLAKEFDSLHLGLFDHATLYGCLMLTPAAQGVIKMRQVAVDSNLQGQGIGRKLVEAAEKHARAKGFNEMQLNARETALKFYLALGYEQVAGPFNEVGIPHFKMKKSLR